MLLVEQIVKEHSRVLQGCDRDGVGLRTRERIANARGLFGRFLERIAQHVVQIPKPAHKIAFRFRLRGAQELDVGGTRLLELGEQRLGDFEGGGGSSFLYCGVEGGLQLLCRA